MDYKGWIIAIYDVYKDKYNKNKGNTESNNKQSLKEVVKFFMKKENIIKGIILFLPILVSIICFIIFVIERDSKIMIYIPMSFIPMAMCILPEWYKYELNLEVYEEHIEILRETLKEKELYNKYIIQELYNSTKGISTYIVSAFGYLFTIGITSGIIDYINIVDYDIMQIMTILLIMIVMVIGTVGYIFYFIMSNLPNSRIQKNKEFHLLLKILIIYDREVLQIDYKSSDILKNISNILKIN